MTKKEKTVKKTDKTKKTTQNKEITVLLNKILTCVYAIILLLVVNTGLLIINGTTNTTSTEAEETNSEYDVSMFDTITPTEFMELLDSDEAQVVYIGRETCGYCTQFLPMMEEGQEEFDFTTKYIDLATFESDENYQAMIDEINGMTDYFNDKNGMTDENKYETIFGYTPTVVVLQSGVIKDVWIGYNEYDQYKTFLEDNEI